MKRRNTDRPGNLIFLIILSGIFLFSVSSFFSHLLSDFLSGLSGPSSSFFRAAGRYLCFIPYWIIIPSAMQIFRSFHVLSRDFMPRDTKRIRRLFIGVIAGFLLAGVCTLIPLLDRSAVLKLNSSFHLLSFPVLFLCILIQAGAEELLFREFLQQCLENCTAPRWVPIILPAFLFAAAHISNAGISFTAIFVLFSSGVLYGLVFHRSGSFWAAAGMHAAWNFCQSIIFGFPNSGVPAEYSLYTANAVRGKTISYDPFFGIEASLSTLAIIWFSILFFYSLFSKKQSK